MTELLKCHWNNNARGRWDGLEQVGMLLHPPGHWRTRRLSAMESVLTERVRCLSAELEALKAQAGRAE